MNKPEPMGIPELIEYHGWTIWGWTGWKGEKSIYGIDYPGGTLWGDVPDVSPVGTECRYCGIRTIKGDVVFCCQNTRHIDHWICKYPDNRPTTLHAQWLASKEENGTRRYCEANCADVPAEKIPAGEYKRGDSFEIVPPEWAITENDTKERKERCKERGFERLKMLIDELNVTRELPVSR